ncbi:MAG: hypothetical protein FGM32_10715 [Candidatus Kapabacteria bacterium]|nr:hypothetical protein [Candidatus Kapabacteria bacterium]
MRYYSFRGLWDLSFHIGVCIVVCTTLQTAMLAGITDPCMSVKIPLSERIQASRAVIYGRVISQRATWDDARRSIYTINTVVVHDVWKSVSGIGDTINVLTEGGDMGTMGRTVVGTLKLDMGDQGYLLLEHPRTGDVTFARAGVWTFYRPYGEVQALLVESSTNELKDCWGGTSLTTSSFERAHLAVHAHAVRSDRPLSSAGIKGSEKSIDRVQGFIAFAPFNVIGGKGDTIMITGFDFGAERGTSYVTFSSDGTNYHDSSYARTFVYRHWSDSKIIVEVPPSYNGKVRVVVGKAIQESMTDLRVTSNLAARSINPLTYTHHVNMNGRGGYTWSMDKKLFDNPQAKSCVESVMREFRCKTGMSFDVSQQPTTAGYALNDGVNAIVFDAPGYELGAGAVAYCDWIWYSCIVGTETFYYIRDMDCRLSTKFNWFYGTGRNPEFGMAKLRYVLFHEIGHAHQFGHVSEFGESMFPIVQALPAEEWLSRDTITVSEQRAGSYMTQLGRTFAFRGCGIQPLFAPENADCSSDTTVDVHEELVVNGVRSWPNPASTVLNVLRDGTVDSDATIIITNMLGEQQEIGTIPRGATSAHVSLSGISTGRYVVSIRMANGAVSIMPLTISR